MKILELISSLNTTSLRNSIRMRRAVAEHNLLLNKETFILDHSLVENAQLLSDRYRLLDQMPRNCVVGEIGVAQGNFSQEILDRCQPSALHLIDPWDSELDPRYSSSSFERIKKKLHKEIDNGMVKLERGYSHDILPKMKEDFFDWVYIDGAHDYKSVKLDLEMCKRVVKPGGIIAGHDYIRWVSPTKRYGVMEAVNEFSNATKSPFVFLTNQFDKHDSFALKLSK